MGGTHCGIAPVDDLARPIAPGHVAGKEVRTGKVLAAATAGLIVPSPRNMEHDFVPCRATLEGPPAFGPKAAASLVGDEERDRYVRSPTFAESVRCPNCLRVLRLVRQVSQQRPDSRHGMNPTKRVTNKPYTVPIHVLQGAVQVRVVPRPPDRVDDVGPMMTTGPSVRRHYHYPQVGHGFQHPSDDFPTSTVAERHDREGSPLKVSRKDDFSLAPPAMIVNRKIIGTPGDLVRCIGRVIVAFRTRLAPIKVFALVPKGMPVSGVAPGPAFRLIR